MTAAVPKPIPNPVPADRYAASEALLERALDTIPLGAQTFSKSLTQYPRGVSPFFADRAKGATLWDVDGHAYADFVMALCAVNLGYGDPAVDAAVRAQLDKGVSFSLSHRLEAEVAERIVAMVPSAEKVRFGKNGSDATAGAVRIARAYTGRDHVLVCGYHGWQDWYIGSTARNRGVPQATQALTHAFAYDDLPALKALLERLDGQVAAIILEPMNVRPPSDGYLAGVRALATQAGAVLIFDETITGFRYAPGGAQERFGVTPDLTTLGKGLANGYPLAAVCGRADIMDLMAEVFFSFTMGGETLSLAAARATLDKIDREPVIGTLRATGLSLIERVERLIAGHGLQGVLGLAGDPSWSFLTFADHAAAPALTIKTLFMQEVFAEGVLAYGSHNIAYAHDESHLRALERAYGRAFGAIAEGLTDGDLAGRLRCRPLEPLFKVRG